jgi:site-specific recombinase XerD
MQAHTMQLRESFNQFENALQGYGLGYSARLTTLKHSSSIISEHEALGLTCLDYRIVARQLNDAEDRFYTGKLSKDGYHLIRRSIQRFVTFIETGSVELPNPLKGSRLKLEPTFQEITDRYLASGDFHPNTRNDMRWIACKYFNWLAENEYGELSNVGAREIQRFLLACSKEMAPSSMHDVKLYVKKLYSFLYSVKQSESPYMELLSFPVNRASKMYPVLPMADVAKLLDSIDRKTGEGKRAYAIMALGVELGIRACDITALKLGDIDWVRGDLKIVQSKTDTEVVLPLTERVWASLQDYILNARPKSRERHVFLRLRAPYKPLKAAVTVGEIYRDCCKAASLPSNKSFHTLRRSLATAMVTSGVDVNDVAQVLGDTNMDSAKKYISLDSANLKRCAIPFGGIAPAGGDAHV